ncbi:MULTISPECIES: hypothetical protein [unclassified Microcoleus]|uniref:hypothetical protein n=1 Tax=unclassified Microcoleus TaxID=2642155 RepID=UPI002FD44D2C
MWCKSDPDSGVGQTCCITALVGGDGAIAAVGGAHHKLTDRCQHGNERFPVLESMESEEIAPLTGCALTSKYFCNCSRLRCPLIS